MRFLVIDSSYLLYKSFFAFSKNHLSVERDGEEIITSAVFGFMKELISLTSQRKYDFIFAAHDTGPYIKKIKYPSYKEGRVNSLPQFNSEKELIKAILYDLNIPSLYKDGYEGEEIANSIIKNLNEHQIELYTNDEDCYVLLSDNVTLIKTLRGDIKLFDTDDLMEKYNITPKQFKTFKILTGCSSDHVTGVDGIGPVYASKIINQFGNIRDILNNLDSIDKNLAEKIKKAKKKGFIKSSMYLTKIQAPDELQQYIPDPHLTYTNILEYLDARTLLTGSNKITLKFIQKNQLEISKKTEYKFY